MENLINIIEEEKKKLEIEKQHENDKDKFLRLFFEKMNFEKVRDLNDINGCELATAMIAKVIPNSDFDSVKDIIYENEVIFEQLDMKSLSRIYETIQATIEYDYFKKLQSSLKYPKKVGFKNLLFEEVTIINLLKISIRSLRISKNEFANLMDIIEKYQEEMKQIFLTIIDLRRIQEEVKRNKDYENIALVSVINQKNRGDLSSSKQQLIAAIDNVRINIEGIKAYYEKLQKAEKSRQKKIEKAQIACETLEEKLVVAQASEEIRNIGNIIDKAPNSALRKEILKVIYNHNKLFYDRLESEYKRLSESDTSQHHVILSGYGINVQDSEVRLIMKNSTDDLEKMLHDLSVMQITEAADVVEILKHSNRQTLNNYIRLIERKTVTSNYFKEHKELFDPSSKEHEDFMKNINALQKNKINLASANLSQNVFLTPHEILNESIRVLKEYAFINALKNTSNYSFLGQEDLSSSIDTLLELGYEKNLEENLEILNYKDKFARLQILKELNIPVTSTPDLLDVLTTDSFLIPDTIIEEYVYNAVDYTLPCIEETTGITDAENNEEKLSEFQNTSRTYSFDGVLISKNKVLRNLNSTTGCPSNTGLLYAIIKNSVLSDEEYAKIESIVVPKTSTESVKQKV